MELKTAQWNRQRGWSDDLPSWDGERTLVMLYGASNLLDDAEPLRDLVARYPTSRLIGCSTAGEIHADTVSDETLTVAVARFASTRLASVHRHVPNPEDSFDVGRAIAGELAEANEDLRAIFVLSDGLAVNGSALTAGMVDATQGRVIITGGLAGDGERFERTWVLVDGEPRRAMVSAIGLSGPKLDVGHGSRGGWPDGRPGGRRDGSHMRECEADLATRGAESSIIHRDAVHCTKWRNRVLSTHRGRTGSFAARCAVKP